MLDENAMPIPANPDKPHDRDCARRWHWVNPCTCSKANEDDETTGPAPDWDCDGRIGIIRFPGGAHVSVQGDDMQRIAGEVDRHGVEILWNYLGIARERSE